MFIPISAWLPAFAATVLIEAPIVWFAVRHVAHNLLATAVVVLFGNLATHVTIWYIATQLIEPGSLAFFAIAEGWAVAGEALLFWAAIPELPLRRAAAASFAANGLSSALGLLVATASASGVPR